MTGLIEPGGNSAYAPIDWATYRTLAQAVRSRQGTRGWWKPVNAGGWGLKCARWSGGRKTAIVEMAAWTRAMRPPARFVWSSAVGSHYNRPRRSRRARPGDDRDRARRGADGSSRRAKAARCIGLWSSREREGSNDRIRTEGRIVGPEGDTPSGNRLPLVRMWKARGYLAPKEGRKPRPSGTGGTGRTRRGTGAGRRRGNDRRSPG